MRTGTLALFRDFRDDNHPARDPQGEASKKTSGKERTTATEMAQGREYIPPGRGFGGDVGDELILLEEWEIDLGNPAFPRVDCSTFLTEQSA